MLLRGGPIMNCSTCGVQLPSDAKACPNCGTLTPAYYANAGSSQHDPTLPAVSGSSPYAMSTPPPSTQYGSNPYEVSQNPYEVSSYHVPPPPPPPRKVSLMMLGILTTLVLVIVGASVGFFLLRNNQSRTTLPPATTALAPTTTTNVTGNANADVTATATAFYGVYNTATSHIPTIDDPLSNNTKGLQWDEGQGCTFTGGAYHVSNTQSSGFQVCLAHMSNFSNFVYQVQMTISKGSYGSLIFRSDNTLSNFYIYRVGQDGVATFALYKNRTNTELKHAPSLAFKQGPNQTNLLAVIAQGSDLICYVNAQYVYDIPDTSLSSGEIGLVAGSLGSPTEVSYTNAKIWVL